MRRKLRRIRHTRPEWVTALNFARVYPSLQINEVLTQSINGVRFVQIHVKNWVNAWYWAKGNAEIRTIGIKPNKTNP